MKMTPRQVVGALKFVSMVDHEEKSSTLNLMAMATRGDPKEFAKYQRELQKEWLIP